MFIFFALSLFFPSPIHAQPKHITCEEWKEILSKKECDYKTLRSDIGKSNQRIWCVSLEEVRSGFDLYSAAPDYTFDFDWDACMESWAQEKGISSAVSESGTTQDKKSLFFIPVELINSVLNIFKSRPKVVQETQQNVKQEPSKNSSQSVNDWIIENFGFSQPQVQEEAFPASLLERTPQIKPDEFSSLSSQARDSLFIPNLNLEATQKPHVRDPETQQIVDLVKSEVTPGSTILTGPDSMMIITPSGGVISLQRNGETTILDIQRKTADEKGPKNILVIIKGEVEVKTKDASIDVETPDAIIRSKGTHYWVTYDPQKKSTVVGVYEGKVEITPRKNNKSVTISPIDGKPGLLGVSQVLSVTKLITFGLVLTGVVGGIVWFVKRKKKR